MVPVPLLLGKKDAKFCNLQLQKSTPKFSNIFLKHVFWYQNQRWEIERVNTHQVSAMAANLASSLRFKEEGGEGCCLSWGDGEASEEKHLALKRGRNRLWRMRWMVMPFRYRRWLESLMVTSFFQTLSELLVWPEQGKRVTQLSYSSDVQCVCFSPFGPSQFPLIPTLVSPKQKCLALKKQLFRMTRTWPKKKGWHAQIEKKQLFNLLLYRTFKFYNL